MVGIAPVLLTLRFSSSKTFSIIFKSSDLVGGGGSRRHLHCLHSDIKWWPLPDGLQHHRVATRSSVVSQQSNDLRIEHLVLIASCS